MIHVLEHLRLLKLYELYIAAHPLVRLHWLQKQHSDKNKCISLSVYDLPALEWCLCVSELDERSVFV